MPELPEIELYLRALRGHILGEPLQKVRLRSPSLLRTWEPPIATVEGKRVTGLRRLGKRIVWEMEDDLFLVIHLMIAGRLKWRKPGTEVPKKGAHAAFDFPAGTILLTEAASHKRASLHLIRGEEGLSALDPGGVEPLDVDLPTFAAALTRENHTLKRALTDPRILAGIGNAHSDEMLFDARLSPMKRTAQLSDDEMERLYEATRRSLREWTDRLIGEAADRFPEKVTAFHPLMRVHGRYGEPCVVCGSPIQRIIHGEHETNYCARCQTAGRLLHDRALSKLLREDWPKTLEELEGR